MSLPTRSAAPEAVRRCISDIGDTLDTANSQYEAVKNEKSLQESFHEAGRTVPLIQQALQEAKPDAARTTRNTISALRDCNTKAEVLRDMLEAVAEASETSRAEAYRAAVKQVSNGRTIEVLVLGVMADMCGLAEDLAIEEKVEEIQVAMDKLSKMESSLPKAESGNVFNHYGSGNQYNAPGGAQNVSKGNGNHFPGASFFGPTTFGAPPAQA